MSDRPIPLGATILAALFVTAPVTSQPTAAQVLAFGIPSSLPIVDSPLVHPGAALAYAVTFFASDCFTELYGKRSARRLVNVAFAMNFVMLALVYSTIAAPAAGSSIDPEMFATVLGASTNIVLGSLVAYLVSQNWDVYVFHAIRERTGKEKLWLRNVASTASSQAIDTVLFVGIAFYLLPQYAGIGPDLPNSVVLSLAVGQYLLKLLIAVVDTPFVYLATRLVCRRESTLAG